MKLGDPAIPAGAWTILIIAACSVPGADLPPVGVELADKVAHFLIFAVFGWLWMRVGHLPAGRKAVIVFAAGTVFAILTELYQGVLPFERTPDALDVLADVTGLAFALVVLLIFRRRSG